MLKTAHAKPSKPTSIARPQPEPIPEANIAAAAEHWMEKAHRLANQGKLVEALEYCEQNSRHQPASAETHYLVGLLHDAAGRVPEAAEHYRKALYLDPHHSEALAHLAVALQKRGDTLGAQRLLERANRRLSANESKGGG